MYNVQVLYFIENINYTHSTGDLTSLCECVEGDFLLYAEGFVDFSSGWPDYDVLISGFVWKANSFTVNCLIRFHGDLPRVAQIFQKHR